MDPDLDPNGNFFRPGSGSGSGSALQLMWIQNTKIKLHKCDVRMPNGMPNLSWHRLAVKSTFCLLEWLEFLLKYTIIMNPFQSLKSQIFMEKIRKNHSLYIYTRWAKGVPPANPAPDCKKSANVFCNNKQLNI